MVWEREIDCYGTQRKLKGDKGFCNYLYQGQYIDQETGLAYNRFRYYDPEAGSYISQDPIGLRGNNPNFYAFVYDNNSETDPYGLIVDPYGGYFSRKNIREQIHKSSRPPKESAHAKKHLQAKTMDEAADRSIKGMGGKPEASYFPEVARNNFANFEKTAAFEAARKGHVVDRGGMLFIIHEHPTDIGFNMGQRTRFMRIEISSGTIHSHPISEADAKAYLKKCG
ncbi:MAG TPA: RHS repeat-associated core domain-containing protein [Cytophagales bacterium]|nr:RHS repeat-associated core domain-containing protein [Cytophagales bacterium]